MADAIVSSALRFRPTRVSRCAPIFAYKAIPHNGFCG